MMKEGKDIKYTQRIIRPAESLSGARAVEKSRNASANMLIDINNLPDDLRYLMPQVKALGISNAMIQFIAGADVEKCLCEFIRRHGRMRNY